ncbi:uroporphyrinogen-III synthase-like isoform X2 [Argopecten irradians]|uniref:uroporphyrinogen-III synthase-like isoform X2 n=1 Tax=Argopecten irradians TaxID=31199 RepID=UPI00371E9D2E
MCLTDSGIKASICSVLTFDFLNLDAYGEQLSKPEEFSSIVFTSQQAVNATKIVLQRSESGDMMQSLSKWTCYVVGEATAAEAHSLGFQPQGQHSGNAEALSEIILKDLNHNSKPILYPCGNLKRDTLPKKMKENGIDLHEVTVYQTIPRADMDTCIKDILSTQGTPSHIVFFSPSGLDAALPVLRSPLLSKDKIQNIAIGNTTREAMAKHLVPVAGVCPKPDPQSLLDVIMTNT